MSDHRDEGTTAPEEAGGFGDPFSEDGPRAQAREERRREREEKRRRRTGGGSPESTPKPMAQTPEPTPNPQPRPEPGSAPDNPPTDSSVQAARMSAEDLMPRREPGPVVHRGGVTDDFELPPAPVQRRQLTPRTGEWMIAEGGSPPPGPGSGGGGSSPGAPRRPKQPPEGGPTWLRWSVALVLIALIVLAAIVAVPELVDRVSGGDEPAPIQQQPRPARTTSLTIPEGYTRAQIAALAKDAGLRGNYRKETRRAPEAFKIEQKGAPADASLEGFLFPSTYELERQASVNDLIDRQLTAYNAEISEVGLKEARKANLTEYDVVTIASMIEREVMVAKERPVVAAVIYNRLREGIPLGIDATLRYYLDNFEDPLTESDLATDSPYNTRLAPGLPPTPIANPGLASLRAAAHPSDDDYLYYVVKPNTCGEHFFTDDYDEFLAASEEYNSAREAKGKAPTDC